MILQQLRSRPAGAAPVSITETRRGFDAMMAMFPIPADVQRTPLTANGVPAEWIAASNASPNRALLYLHGGGYVIGSITSHREMVARLARAAGARALAIDYRLAPEHPFPGAVEDATAAYRWLLAQGFEPARIVIAGDSAGGGLTVATLVALRDAGDPRPAAGVCMSPWVDLEGLGRSMTANAARDPLVQKDGLVRWAGAYLAGAHPRTPLAAPLYADLRGLPPLLIQVSTAETLYDDATRLTEKARAAGVDVTLEPWPEMVHVWQLFAPLLPEGQQALARAGAFVAQRMAGAPVAR
jgi:acetyl esterase/lipase